MDKIKVGVNGYGTIGKRVADAVLLQKDMELAGITANTYNYRIEVAKQRGIPIYAVGSKEELLKNGINLRGDFNELLDKLDVVVDCTPKPFGMENKKVYTNKNVKAIYQGGEKAGVGDCSFVAQCNYNDALNKNHVRVVSCNTTGLARTLHAISQHYAIQRVRATLMRRATDPNDTKKGPINAIVPSLELPSHHGPDVRTVLPNIEVFTTAVVVPTTLMHMHNLSVFLKDKKALPADIVNIFKNTTRVRVIKESEKVNSTAEIMELARDLGHKRGDMMDICVWEKGVGCHDYEIFYTQAVHQESDVIPENIDAIRAVMGFADAQESIRMTNKGLGLK